MPEPVDESGLPVNEPQEPPVPSATSTPPIDKPPSIPTGEAPDVAAKIQALEATVKELKEAQVDIPDAIERGIHSTKDKRFRRLEGLDPETLEQFSEYLKKFDGDVAKATRELALDLMLQSGSPSPTVQGNTDGGGVGATDSQMSAISVRILTEAGIPFDDPGYNTFIDSLAGRKFTEAEFERATSDWVIGRLRQASAPPGSLVSESAPPPAPANLQAEYDKEFEALKGTRDAQGLIALKRKYRQLGLKDI